MQFLHSFKYAIQGVKSCFLGERNFRIELIIAFATFCLGFVFKLSGAEWLAVLFCAALVLCLEMINSSVEKLCDAIIKSNHPEIKQVKDIAAGAVSLAAVMSFITGCIIFLPKLIVLIKHF